MVLNQSLENFNLRNLKNGSVYIIMLLFSVAIYDIITEDIHCILDEDPNVLLEKFVNGNNFFNY